MGITDKRWDKIIAILSERKRGTVNEFAKILEVSRETIRRDLTELDSRGLLQKVHGGAVYVHSAAEGAFRKRMSLYSQEKLIIADLVGDLLQPGDSVMLNAGTTTLAVSNVLASHQGLRVVTNSMDIASRLMRGTDGDGRVYLLGGILGQDSQTYGDITIEEIGRFQVDHAILTIGGLNEESIFFGFGIEIASVARAMMKQSRTITVVAPSQKFGHMDFVRMCSLSKIDRLVTNQQPSGTIADALKAAGVEVITGK